MELRDEPREVELTSSEIGYVGAVWQVKVDEFKFGDGILKRDYLFHSGAVAVLVVDEQERCLVLTQYRHPVGQQMVEIPAGLLDHPGESPLAGAKRELLEETGYVAHDWSCLVDICTSPGCSSEALRIYLAKKPEFVGRTEIPTDNEEAEIQCHWVAISQAVDSVLNGHWQNPAIVAGVLGYAACQGKSQRPPDSPWPHRDWLKTQSKVLPLNRA